MTVLGNKSPKRHPVLKIRLVSEDGRYRSEVKQALLNISDLPIEITESSPQPNSFEGTDPLNLNADVVMITLNGNKAVSLGYLQAQAQACSRPVLVALLQERSSDLMRQVLAAGADEMLFLPLESDDVTRALLKVSESRKRLDRVEGGLVCSVVSLAGGVGVTTISGNLALAMRRESAKRVALVDLDFQRGGLAILLGVEPKETISLLTEPGKRLDSIQLEAALTKHDSGIYLLAAPARIEESEMVSEEVVGPVLDLMRQLFDFVVVDCGHRADDVTATAWEHSDQVLYLLDQSIMTAHYAQRFLELFGRLRPGAGQPQLVLNRFTASHSISEQDLSDAVGLPIFSLIPSDAKSLESAQLNGQELWKVAPGSKLAYAIVDLARKVDRPRPQSAGRLNRVRLFSRVLTAIGLRAAEAKDVPC